MIPVVIVHRQKGSVHGPSLEQIPFKERRTLGARLLQQVISCEGDSKMTRHDQELLDKQRWGVSSSPTQDGIIVLMIIAVFLLGLGAGGILYKTMKANTHYAALISFPNGQE